MNRLLEKMQKRLFMPESAFSREICNEILCSNHSSHGESEDSVLVCSYQAQSNALPIPFDNPRRPLKARNRIPKLASGCSEYSKEERHSNWWNSGGLISSLVAGEPPICILNTLHSSYHSSLLPDAIQQVV